MREINEESVSSFLENKEAMAPCDVAAFVYDRYAVLICLVSWKNILPHTCLVFGGFNTTF